MRERTPNESDEDYLTEVINDFQWFHPAMYTVDVHTFPGWQLANDLAKHLLEQWPDMFEPREVV